MRLTCYIAVIFNILACRRRNTRQNIENAAYSFSEYVKIKETKLAQSVKRMLKNPDFKDVPVKSVCELGFAADNICNLADKYNADLIVMGTTGASGLKELTLGSVAGSIIRKTEVPILIVPEVFDSITLNDVFVLASDMSNKMNEKSKAVVESFTKMQNATLKVVNVSDKEGERPSSDAEKKISDMLSGVQHDFHYLHGGQPNVAIRHFLETVEASLLCMISHHHGFLYRLFYDSTTRQMSYHTQIPLLVLHD